MPISPDQFREGMRRLAASVTVVTTKFKGRRYGMTATAVCSVSGSPPTLLCCINSGNFSHDAFKAADGFAVNVLACEDEALSNMFASQLPHEDRFKCGEWSEHESGVPVLDSAAACFVCHTAQAIDAGSHTIFLGEICDVHTHGSSTQPLLYAHGGYGRFNSASTCPE